jgi:hypothetical protein
MRTATSSLLTLAIVLAIPSVASAQQGWQSKPYQQWTKDDIIKIASDSPWAQVQQAKPTTGESVPTDYIPSVTIRLRSALPIRQALLRLKQIAARYDRMSDQERAAFDTKLKGLLECPACVDNYVVTLGPPISQHQMKNGLGTLVNANISLLRGRVYLINDAGERRDLVHFIAPKQDEDEATFFFPRLDEKGRPFLTPNNKKLVFVFEAKNLRSGYRLDSIPERFEFDVSKFTINGKVEF